MAKECSFGAFVNVKERRGNVSKVYSALTDGCFPLTLKSLLGFIDHGNLGLDSGYSSPGKKGGK